MGVKDKAFTWSESTNRAVYGLNSFHAKGYPVKSSDLESLNGAIERWSKFLRSVFLGSSVGYVAPEKLHQMSLEDTEFYLDVKIQLSQCMAGVQDDILANRLEMICNDIRKNSYRFLSNTMPMLNENSRLMVENKHQTGLIKSQSNKVLSSGGRIDSDVEQDSDLSARRKKIMVLVNRQHRDVIHNLAQLNHKISENLYSDEFEL